MEYGREEEIFETVDEVEVGVKEKIKEEEYMMEEGIWVLKHEGVGLDLGVLREKNVKGCWERRGIVGRVGGGGKMIRKIDGGGG
ncbi:YheC/YheD family protein, partial [Paenibacillus xylanexedens]|uniref:YheC/YheD family protein n=1 Tax=Paenibacillus xylanexedens TaxID=528191 RepID=UPI00119DD4D7